MEVKELKKMLEGCDDNFNVYVCSTEDEPVEYGTEVSGAVITSGEKFVDCITLIYEG